MRASFYTFGCKLNQFETEALASAFQREGFTIVSPNQGAEYYLINTCTVTARSEQKARRLIRQLSRSHENSLVIVTGCYAQLNREALAALGPNIVVVPQDRKAVLLDLPAFLGEAANPLRHKREGFQHFYGSAAIRSPAKFPFQVERYSFHARAVLKIQDGCDYSCAYCRVPLARGPALSLDPQEVIARAQRLEQRGHREVVLTGVNITAYRYGAIDLAELLRRLLRDSQGLRFRLSSLEPERIDQDLVAVLEDPRICPHFHLAVQSGSDRILAAMQRRYQSQAVISAVHTLREIRPEAFFAADMLVGFPGEREEDFQTTCTLVEELKLGGLHVFPFSPRPGTRAEKLPERVPERIRDRRVHVLRALSRRLFRDYAAPWQGRAVEAILETARDPECPVATIPAEALWRGVSGNYLKLIISAVPGSAAQAGRLVEARIQSVDRTIRARYLSDA